MGAFRTVIGCNLDQYETGSFEPTRYLVLDTQEERTVKASAVIAKQPLQNGDTMSDHMYREPTEFTITGAFSLNGKNWDDDSYDFMRKGDRVTNVQEVFEYIKDNGILCRLTTVDEDDFSMLSSASRSSSGVRTRFKTRDNMALISIQWTEKQNSVHFSFTFHQVIMVEKQEYEELKEDERSDLGLPYVTSPTGASLGTVLAETGALKRTILRTLYDNGYINDDWFILACEGAMEIVKDVSIATAIISVGLAVAVITAIPAAIAVAGAVATGGSVLAALAGSVSAIFPVGTIVVAVAAVIAGLAVGISNFIEWIKKKKKQTIAFKLVNGKPDQDLYRLVNLFQDVELRVNKVKTGLTIYSISKNVRQTVTLNIAGDYYLIEFDKNNAEEGESWGAKITDLNGDAINTVARPWPAVSSFLDLDRNHNLWFKDKSLQYEVYLVNPSLSSTVNDTPEKIAAAKTHLEGYSIWVSKGNVQKQIEAVEKAIENAIEEEGFV